MSAADLPLQRGASDIAAALRLTTAGLVSAGGLTVDELHQRDQLDAMTRTVEPLPLLLPPVVDVVEHQDHGHLSLDLSPAEASALAGLVRAVDPCTCPPAAICAGSCAHCAGLPDDAPCPHDTMPAGEPAPACCPHGPAEHDPATGDCGRCDHSGQPAALEVSGVDRGIGCWPPAVDVVHQVAAQQLAAAGVDVVVDWPAVAHVPLTDVAADELRRRYIEARAAGGGVAVLPPDPVLIEPRPSTGHLPTLDWRGRHDVRSLSYGVREHLLTAEQPLQLADVLLPIGPVLDQGAEGQCVGMGVVDAANVLDELAGNLDGQLLGEDAASRLYRRAQQLDDRPGESYSGTSVLAGMAAGVEAGLWSRYLWSFGTRDIAATILRRRPVVIGIPWLSGMYETAAGGRVDVAGADTGAGHCLVIVGMRLTGPQGQPGPWFVWLNSWGTGYGDGGLGYVHHRDLARLLRSQGEAAVPLPTGSTP